jgi:peptide/nickel transport system substrate-binding protein
MPDAAAQVAGLQAGEIQFIEDVNGSAVSQLDQSKFRVYKALPFYLQVLKFNHAQMPTGDVNFRRAVAAALDMKQIMEIAFPDINVVDGGWVFPNSPYANQAGLDLYNVHDLDEAKTLLAKSPYKGEKLTFIIDDYRPDVDTATNIQEQLSQIGINIDIRVSDWATVEKLGFTPNGWHFWAHGVGIEPYEGPGTVMSIWAGGKSQIKDDPVIDDLYARYTSELDQAKRKQIFADFQKHMWEDAVGLQLGNYGLFQVSPVSLTNFVPYRIPRMWGVWLV